jgi:pSer/pThr/pTyr-binding forkhead associated (FHA) protein
MSRRLLLDDGRNQRELVIRDKMTIGRDPACDISDADPRLSRRHAEFLMTPRGLMVRDLDSRNGVRVNGRMVQEALLTAGDLVELAHLSVRFVEDTPTEPAGQAFPSGIHSGIVPRPVESVQVKDGFEDDRTRVVAPSSSITPSGPVDGQPTATMMRAALSRDAGEVTIRTSQALPALRRPRPGFGVRDLVSTGWGARVLAQGALLAMVVFLITVVPMLNWFTGVTGPVPNGLLVRMLAAPLLAALAAGLMVASLIARTTARGLGRDDESQA